MADLSITAANVAVGNASTRTKIVQFGETVTNGQSVYLKASDGKYWKADVNASSEAAAAEGVVLVGAAGDAYGAIVIEGQIIIGATVTNGLGYGVSATAGGIAPDSDFAGTTGGFQRHLGHGIGTTKIDIRPKTTGAVT